MSMENTILLYYYCIERVEIKLMARLLRLHWNKYKPARVNIFRPLKTVFETYWVEFSNLTQTHDICVGCYLLYTYKLQKKKRAKVLSLLICGMRVTVNDLSAFKPFATTRGRELCASIAQWFLR